MNIIKRKMKTQENIKRKINTQNATIYIYQEYRSILLNIMAANQNKMPYIPLKKEWLKRFDVDLSLFLGGDIKEITELVEELKKDLIAIAESYNYVSDGEFEIRKTNSKMIDENQEEYMTKKPPIGIIPRYIWELKRIKELKSAIRRFIDAGKEIQRKYHLGRSRGSYAGIAYQYVNAVGIAAEYLVNSALASLRSGQIRKAVPSLKINVKHFMALGQEQLAGGSSYAGSAACNHVCTQCNSSLLIENNLLNIDNSE